MKNVLNDDGDKISLFSSDGMFLSSCEKSEGGEAIVTGNQSGDIFPMSKMQSMSMMNMYLCYWRITMVFCMYIFADTVPILFMGAFIVSLLLDSVTRSISSRSDNCNYLFTGLATICDVFLLVVLYQALGQRSFAFSDKEEQDLFEINKMSYVSFMTAFLSSAGKVITPKSATTSMMTFLVVDLLSYGCHLFSLLFQTTFNYSHISEKYTKSYPKMIGLMQILQVTFVMQHYGLGHLGNMLFMDNILYSLTLCSFLFMRFLNACVVYSAIRLWTVNSDVQLSDVGEELDEYLRLQSPAPMLDSRIPLSNPRRTSMASSASSSPPATKENTPSPQPVVARRAASVIRSNIKKRTKTSSSSSSSTAASSLPSLPLAPASSSSPTTTSNTAANSKKRKSVSIAAPQSATPSRHHHLGESNIQSDYSLRDGSSLQHNPHNPYVVHDEDEEQPEAGKKKAKKSVSIQEPVSTPAKTPSSNSTKSRKKTPAAKSK